VNAIAPGYIESSGLDTYDEKFRPILKNAGRLVPFKRFGTEAEISSAICFLLSDAAAYITGACINIDGGASLNTHFCPIPDHKNSTPYKGWEGVDEGNE